MYCILNLVDIHPTKSSTCTYGRLFPVTLNSWLIFTYSERFDFMQIRRRALNLRNKFHATKMKNGLIQFGFSPVLRSVFSQDCVHVYSIHFQVFSFVQEGKFSLCRSLPPAIQRLRLNSTKINQTLSF